MFRKGLPNFVTSLGLVSGCMSIVYSVSGDLYTAGIMILVAASFDFLDGMLARMLKSISEFGKQLDSLADVISFGVAPAFIVKRLVEISLTDGLNDLSFKAHLTDPGVMLLLYSPFLIAVFSALRLARFNLDKDQAESFKGLATPANAILLAGLGFIANENRGLFIGGLIGNRWFIMIMIIFSCCMLVSSLPMFSLKFKTYGLVENRIRYVFLAASVVLLLVLGLQALSFIIILYIVLSLLNNRVFKMS